MLTGNPHDEDSELQAALEMSLHSAGGAAEGNGAAAAASGRPHRGDDGAEPHAAVAASLQQQAGVAASATATTDQDPPSQPHRQQKGEERREQPAAAAAAAAASVPHHHKPDDEGSNGAESAEPEAFDVAAFHAIMWDTALTTDSDKDRWVGQGIDVQSHTAEGSAAAESSMLFGSMLDVLAETHLPWGLVQQHGGPCGVLAAVQAEMLRLLLFDWEGDRGDLAVAPARLLNAALIRKALARAVAIVLARAALAPPASDQEKLTENLGTVRIVLPASWREKDEPLEWKDLEPWSTESKETSNNSLAVYSIPDDTLKSAKRQKTDGDAGHTSLDGRIRRLAAFVETFLLQKHGEYCPLDCFRRQGGVLLLVMSLVASRSAAVLQAEFDLPLACLTSQFGHCGQELINLLLTGQAVSNVFDNTLTPSGDMTCRGIQLRPTVGYLTQLEALRYCEVGDYYKSPRYPVWVVGSTSHFTVLFGEAAALRESESDQLLERCRRAFKSVEGGEENGFIDKDKLGAALDKLNIRLDDKDASTAASRVEILAASLEVTGAGIILWDDFWKAVSRLLTGATLEAVLNDDRLAGATINLVDNDDELPPLLTNYAENPEKPVAQYASPNAPLGESDEAMARRLAAEWGSEQMNSSPSGMAALSVAAQSASPMQLDTPPPMSDEELAKKLQAEWDSEVSGPSFIGGGSSVAAVSGSPVQDDTPMFPATPPSDVVMESEEEDRKPAAKETVSREPPGASSTQQFEQFGDTFLLQHYNGLRGGVLTPFRVKRLSPEEAVGASIALNRGGASSHHGNSSGSQDLEDVVRTKWPSCMIDWLGRQPPYID